MKKIDGTCVETYEFIGGDINPVAKKINSDGNYTDEIYNKEQIVDTLEKAVNSNKNIAVVEEVTKENKTKYIFRFEQMETNNAQIVSIVVNNPGYLSVDTGTGVSKDLLEDKYVNRLSKLKSNKAKLKKDIKEIATVLASGIVVAGMIGAMIYTDYKEQLLKSQHNKEYLNKSYSMESDIQSAELDNIEEQIHKMR